MKTTKAIKTKIKTYSKSNIKFLLTFFSQSYLSQKVDIAPDPQKFITNKLKSDKINYFSKK